MPLQNDVLKSMLIELLWNAPIIAVFFALIVLGLKQMSQTENGAKTVMYGVAGIAAQLLAIFVYFVFSSPLFSDQPLSGIEDSGLTLDIIFFNLVFIVIACLGMRCLMFSENPNRLEQSEGEAVQRMRRKI